MRPPRPSPPQGKMHHCGLAHRAGSSGQAGEGGRRRRRRPGEAALGASSRLYLFPSTSSTADWLLQPHSFPEDHGSARRTSASAGQALNKLPCRSSPRQAYPSSSTSPDHEHAKRTIRPRWCPVRRRHAEPEHDLAARLTPPISRRPSATRGSGKYSSSNKCGRACPRFVHHDRGFEVVRKTMLLHQAQQRAPNHSWCAASMRRWRSTVFLSQLRRSVLDVDGARRWPVGSPGLDPRLFRRRPRRHAPSCREQGSITPPRRPHHQQCKSGIEVVRGRGRLRGHARAGRSGCPSNGPL